MTLDLASLTPTRDESTLQLRHPLTDEILVVDGAPITITVFGEASPQYRKALHRISDRRLSSAKGRRSLQKSPKMEELDSEMIELLAEATKTWSDNFVFGTPLAFSRDNARLVYDKARWITDQVSDHMREMSNFLESSDKDSSQPSSSAGD